MNDILLPPCPVGTRLAWRLRPDGAVAFTLSHRGSRHDAILTARQRAWIARHAPIQTESGRSARRSAASWAGSGARP